MKRLLAKNQGLHTVLIFYLCALLILAQAAWGQETTASLQGHVKDVSGAMIAQASVEVTSPGLIGVKKTETDAVGNYRFDSLPPGTYTLTVSARNFRAYKQTGIELSAGRLPSIEVTLQVGAISEVMEVSGQAPLVDVTSSKAMVTVTPELFDNLPKGRNFASLIPFAPGARQEPLQSNDRGRSGGYQIDGASDGDNQYLVEGLDNTEIRNGGVRNAVPMEFVQEVQVKSSGFEAEFGGGAGVVNVVQKRGTSAWHGSILAKYSSDRFNANDQCFTNGGYSTLRGSTNAIQANRCGARGNPLFNQNVAQRLDRPLEYYLGKKDHERVIDPGFEVGGPLLTDRLWMYASYVPDFDKFSRTVNFTAPNTGANLGPHQFWRSLDTHNALLRFDYKLTEKVRLFAAWQYGYARRTGDNVPSSPDSLIGQPNAGAQVNPSTLRPDTGVVQPMDLWTFGGDWTPSSKLVVTGRFGYFFYNTGDRGKPTGTRYLYDVALTANTRGFGPGCTNAATCPFIDTTGASNGANFASMPSNQQNLFEALKRKQLATDVSYHVGHFLGGTHTFKFGYGFNRLSDDVLTIFKTGLVVLDWAQAYSPLTAAGNTACIALRLTNADGVCAGSAGYVTVQDGVDVAGNVNSYNHSLFAQDSWSIKRLTINAGVRFDKEHVPPFSAGANELSFGFGQKIAPRIGAAYDLLGNGKAKIYGSYGKFFDIMKYSLPRGSFGGEYWHDCVYALNSSDIGAIVPTGAPHTCLTSGQAPGVTPGTGAIGTFIENVDLRKNILNPTLPGLDPNIKPQQQHEIVFGADFAIRPTVGLEVRYSRKRLDWAIEDMALTDNLGFYIGNPGTPFADLIARVTPPDSGVVGDPGHPAECPIPTCSRPGPKALRRYDGLEFRLTKKGGSNFFGEVSYAYSRLRGNYSGLTATTITDGNGIGGRHNPNNDRSFDAPQMQWDSHGHIVDGPLGTDRPHALKVLGWYRLKWLRQETTFGVSQAAFAGTPINTCWNTNGGADGCVFVEGRDGFVKLHVAPDPANPAQGIFVSDGVVKGMRTPWIEQTDFNFVHEVKVSKKNENMRMAFEWNVQNLLNQRAPMVIWPAPIFGRFNGVFPATVSGGGTVPDPFPAIPGAINQPTGVDFHAFTIGGWDYIKTTNATPGMILDSTYGKPVIFQASRTMRFKIRFTF